MITNYYFLFYLLRTFQAYSFSYSLPSSQLSSRSYVLSLVFHRIWLSQHVCSSAVSLLFASFIFWCWWEKAELWTPCSRKIDANSSLHLERSVKRNLHAKSGIISSSLLIYIGAERYTRIALAVLLNAILMRTMVLEIWVTVLNYTSIIWEVVRVRRGWLVGVRSTYATIDCLKMVRDGEVNFHFTWKFS